MTRSSGPIRPDATEALQSTAAPGRLRVLHLNTFDDSGASRGSLWLHQALCRKGIDSTVLVGRKTGVDPTVITPPSVLDRLAAKVRMRLDRLPLRRYRKTDDAFWSIGWVPARIDALVRAMRPDIVHLHWIGNGFVPIREMGRFGCPAIWTLRDMWAFTGGCHYTAGCQAYRTGCGSCPQLRSSDRRDLSRQILESKARHWAHADLTLVPISTWLNDCVRSSPLLRRFPSAVIPNGVDIDLFRPASKAKARQEWGLPADRRILVFGAINAMRDPRKGFPELVAALRHLAATGRSRDLMFVVFGDLRPGDLPATGIETRNVGYVGDDRMLALLYSAADLAVIPSIQEAFGKTLIEAMACGAPVVAFASGGPRDIVTHRRDGYLAQPFRADDLARGIAWCLDALERGENLQGRARTKVEAEFDIDLVADRYLALYRQILSERSGVGARVSVSA